MDGTILEIYNGGFDNEIASFNVELLKADHEYGSKIFKVKNDILENSSERLFNFMMTDEAHSDAYFKIIQHNCEIRYNDSNVLAVTKEDGKITAITIKF